MTPCKARLLFLVLCALLLGASPSQGGPPPRIVITSDTILSGMIASLLPANRYTVEAILPPGQCPGHYDVRLSDIEKAKQADLVVSFLGMPFLNKALPKGRALLLVDAGGRNWMAPESHLFGLALLSGELARRFPEDEGLIAQRRRQVIRLVEQSARGLLDKTRRAAVVGKPVLASTYQQELLAWMGLTVVGTYGRPESLSTRDVVRLTRLGKTHRVVAVVDNLQSGPDTGRGIAEALGAAHVALTNFPSEAGYLATLEQNIDVVLSAVLGRQTGLPESTSHGTR